MLFFSAATSSVQEFAKVKAGLDTAETLPYEYIWWFLGGLILILGVSIVVALVRKKRHLTLFRGWTSINEPGRITALLKRAAARQADCSLEIFDHQHVEIYKGIVHEARAGRQLMLELSRLPGQGVEFEGFPAQIHLNFRPGPKEPMEHYQFSSHTLFLNMDKEKKWRVARVAVAWPQNIISAQRRDFLRVEPLGSHSMKAAVYAAPEGPDNMPDGLKPLVTGEVLDISVGGAQIVFSGIPQLKEGHKYMVVVVLPLDRLDLELKQTRLYLEFNTLSRDVIVQSAGDKAGDQPAPAHTIIRGGFTARYRFREEVSGWDRTYFNIDDFQDLAGWVHAYQRFLLKKEKGLDSSPLQRVNLYPAIPPERPEQSKEE
ncbi:hypothetical protein LJB86_06235 [Deltaproteobacteria bacterium OttesenSCG-928-M10]|nr:hypothetical protein [Deltaproteobacteria bacterium OttesenSCG-928-M10]